MSPEDVNTSTEKTVEVQKDTNITEPTVVSEYVVICAFDCTDQDVKRCRKCNRPFCIIHCNHFSPNFCKECFKDLSIVAEKFKRTFDYIGDNGQLYTKTEERTRYYLDGMDWPFVTPWINSLSDDEFKMMWVFHHCIMRLIEAENDTRNIQRARSLREHVVPKLVTQTVTKRVTKVQVPETPETLKTKWQKQGIPENVIVMMLAALEQKP